MLITTLLWCFWEYFQTGLFAVGGGLATIPFLEDMAGRHPDWFTLEELRNFVAVSESTPGPIGINIATYAGYKIAGPLGSVVCVFALVLPAFLIMVIVAKMLQKFKNSSLVNNAFYGIRPATTALILSAVLSTFTEVLIDMDAVSSIGSLFTAVEVRNVILFAVILAASLIFKKLHPIVFIAAGAAAGVIFAL
ncbi:MAG: chromate transporter [Clostridia bacterium]|nr:chromate transporter [Clostridia bacterium]